MFFETAVVDVAHLLLLSLLCLFMVKQINVYYPTVIRGPSSTKRSYQPAWLQCLISGHHLHELIEINCS